MSETPSTPPSANSSPSNDTKTLNPPSFEPVRRMSVVEEFILFLKENKAYWMAPILIVLFLLILLVVFGGTAASPFIYTLF